MQRLRARIASSRDAQLIRARRRQIHRMLLRLPDGELLFYPNPGNAGDSLIYVATLQAFRRAGVRVRRIGAGDRDVQGRTVLVGGGGNFVPLYQHVHRLIDAVHGEAAQVVVLPHTIRGHEDLLGVLDRRHTLICRDRTSYRHVRSTSAVQVDLAHDMAFHLDARSFLSDPALTAEASPVLRSLLGEFDSSAERIASSPSVGFFRSDDERCEGTPPSDVDISRVFTFGDTLERAEVSAWCLLRCISLARHIRTDRLHVAIGAALLGVPCDLYDNSYGKNRAVSEFSLNGFSRHRWVERPAAG